MLRKTKSSARAFGNVEGLRLFGMAPAAREFPQEQFHLDFIYDGRSRSRSTNNEQAKTIGTRTIESARQLFNKS
ncbi:hypothetical protein CQ14_03525 [Bradyrhizobium lablabi]|uniref:Uncharacterized protein n=1 Tax=Bradyrhizobium lablabi TaxID=722472 RepID=A0A0R3M531_9BRAD|nr:hypothetical protein CQ14_03525 [Bradyrhizobium lablabi]